MRENPTMRAVLCATAATLVLTVAGCGGAPEGETQQAMTEDELGLLEQRVTAMEATLDFQFGPGDQTRATIHVWCAEDPCARTLWMPPDEHRICHPGNGHCPTQVHWRVVGAQACWTEGTDSVVIQKKVGEQDCFPQQSITGSPWSADSGPPAAACQPTPGNPIPWWYEVQLKHEGCPDVLLDPVVIIEPY